MQQPSRVVHMIDRVGINVPTLPRLLLKDALSGLREMPIGRRT
jgi:hypothetical protein